MISNTDVTQMLELLMDGKALPERAYRILCEKAKDILIEESNVVPVRAPVNVCGDIHGQYHDLKNIFVKGGEIPDKSYIFIGDFVDRGFNSVETFQLLLALKVKYPGHITLIRGNHESRQCTSMYGFYEECLRKYGNINVWRFSCDVFDHLPVSAVVEGKIFCVHGGLSPNIKSFDQIRTLERKQELPHDGPLADLMWSDPDQIETWGRNSRGAGWIFGSKVTSEFNHINGLTIIARAHQLMMEGYRYYFDKKLCTVWSAPNYCYRCHNVASIMQVDENCDHEFLIFHEVEGQQSLAKEPKSVVPYFL